MESAWSRTNESNTGFIVGYITLLCQTRPWGKFWREAVCLLLRLWAKAAITRRVVDILVPKSTPAEFYKSKRIVYTGNQ